MEKCKKCEHKEKCEEFKKGVDAVFSGVDTEAELKKVSASVKNVIDVLKASRIEDEGAIVIKYKGTKVREVVYRDNHLFNQAVLINTLLESARKNKANLSVALTAYAATQTLIEKEYGEALTSLISFAVPGKDLPTVFTGDYKAQVAHLATIATDLVGGEGQISLDEFMVAIKKGREFIREENNGE